MKQLRHKKEIPYYRLAYISTQHMSELDGKLVLDRKAPYRTSETDWRSGSTFYIPHKSDMAWKEVRHDLFSFGFSEAFIALFKRLRELGFAYVQFDSDGEAIPGRRKFVW